MKKYFTILALLLFLILQTKGQDLIHNNVIVFDITGSMVGLPANSGNTDIWTPSLDLLKKQLNSFPRDERINLFLFGEELIKLGDYSTNSGEELASRIVSSIDSMKANNLLQNYTCIYQSLEEIISNLDDQYVNTIYLFTDGRNSDSHAGCGNRTAEELADKWEEASRENEFLYIFKLKAFNLPDGLNGRTIEVIDDALTNYSVVIEPKSTAIRVSRRNTSSSQAFRITGAGVEYLPIDLSVIADIQDLRSPSGAHESAYIDPETLQGNSSVQGFDVKTLNMIENISSEIYKGALSYTFSDHSLRRTVSIQGMNLTISIKDIDVEVIFNNEEEESMVKIEFID